MEGCEVCECFEMVVGFVVYDFGCVVVSSMNLLDQLVVHSEQLGLESENILLYGKQCECPPFS